MIYRHQITVAGSAGNIVLTTPAQSFDVPYECINGEIAIDIDAFCDVIDRPEFSLSRSEQDDLLMTMEKSVHPV